MATVFSVSVPQLLIAAFAAAGIALVAWRAHSLSLSGAVAAFGVGFLLFGLGGWRGAAALLLFFITSTLLSKIGKRRKEALAFEKGDTRDAGQVLANGGVAAVCAILLLVFPQNPLPIFGLLGALATANSDTWATEIGAFVAQPPRLITNFKRAPVGSSGAVSIAGTGAAFLGALLIAVMALVWGLGFSGLIAVIVGGFGGALFDSLLGATVQLQYRCAVCGKLTERKEHHETQTVWARGISGMNNDAVNALSTLFGSLLAMVLGALWH